MSGDRLRLLAWKRVRKGASLRGFANVAFPTGIELPDCPVHVASGRKAWAAIPGKARIGRDGELMRNAAGKIEYTPVLNFASKRLRDAFSERVVDLVREHDPAAIDEDVV